MPQFISINLVKNGSILYSFKKCNRRIQSGKAFHIESSTIYLLQYCSDLSLDYLSDLVVFTGVRF